MERVTKINKQGQLIGRKGLLTRERLLDATLKVLRSGSRDALVVSRIAEEAATAPPTFYLYFNDVDDAICALAERLVDDFAGIADFVARPWPPTKIRERARTLVGTYFKVMKLNREVLQHRNTEADRGSERFVAVRLRAVMPLLEALATKFLVLRGEGESGREQAFAQAAVVVTSMERLAARVVPNVTEPGVSEDALMNAQAEIIARLGQPTTVRETKRPARSSAPRKLAA